MLSGESIIAPQEKEESSMKESRRKQIESLLAERAVQGLIKRALDERSDASINRLSASQR